jgi:phosphohistidine phosphatase
MELYLIRHAIAERRDPGRWPDDAKRPLTQAGRERFVGVAHALQALGIAVDAVLASPYVRAWQTAEVLQDEAGWPAPTPCSELEPGVPPATFVESLSGRSEASLALVGHEPDLSLLASLVLTGSSDGVRLELKKGGVICLYSGDTPTPGAGVLRWSAAPKLLRRLSS